MKIALAQLNFQIGAFGNNTAKIIQAIKDSKNKGAELIVFPELAITAYPPRDFLEFSHFINQCQKSIETIALACDGIAAIVGAPFKNPTSQGKKLFNSAFFLSEKKIQQVIHKSLLPTYDIFDEYRYFEPNRKFELIEYKWLKIALTICEDIWNIYTPYYSQTPMDELSKGSPDLMINIAASPFSTTHNNKRQAVLKKNVEQYGLPILYVNHVGAQTEILYDGASSAYNAEGKLIARLPLFKEDIKIVDTTNFSNYAESIAVYEKETIQLIHDALVMGIRDYFAKLGFKKAILGLSGGIDSAVTCVLLERALGKENVTALLLPSMFSSGHSVADAEELGKNLGIDYKTLSIADIYDTIGKELSPWFKGLEFNIAEENIQSRTRAVLLMAFSNKFGHILINTSNKSELAVGYGTLYGDMCGGISVLGDVYKTQVFELARYINKKREVIPENTITKPPSAELKPDQKDSDSLPDYPLLDNILYQYIEERKGIIELVQAGFDEALVKQIIKMVNTNEHKRYQAPPVLRVSDKAFGIGRRMPIVAKYDL